jgi:hypothetical protein
VEFEFVGRLLDGCPMRPDDSSFNVVVTLQDMVQRFLEDWIERDSEEMSVFVAGSPKAEAATVLAWSI